ncbi:MAG: B12-binding domain-containing radical SAM protein [Alphaproteobacteria bacterium]
MADNPGAIEAFFLCDPTHTAQGLNAELIPYALGCIKSYFHANATRPAEIRLFKYPETFAEAFLTLRPTLVGFSNYAWNLDLSYSLAEEVKRHAPETLVVFGGPNYPLEAHRQQQWLAEHPAIDLYVVGEGEVPFQRIAETWLDTHDIGAVQRAGIVGTHVLIDGVLTRYNPLHKDGFDDFPRITDLDATPSPYLMGYLDTFLEDRKLSPLMECSRGCPYACTYCVDGIGGRNKVHRASVERLEAELRYIAVRHKGTYLTLADTNFGMYKEDVEFSKIIARIREEHNYPHHMQVTAGKSQLPRIIECSEILKGALRFGASVQSLDPDVLANIKRHNISLDTLLALSQHVSDTETTTYSDVIVPLPGDSKAKHINSICQLVDADLNQVRMHTLMVLNGSELATDASRQRFGMKTRFRVVPRSFGRYWFGNRDLVCVEIEEVCVENENTPFSDYLECRRFDCTVALFYNERMFLELTRLVRARGLRVSDWLMFLHQHLNAADLRVQELYARFLAETEAELSPSRERLAEEIKNKPGVLEDYIAGVRGNNIMFNTQVIARLNILPQLHAYAFAATRSFLKSKGSDIDTELDAYLGQLEIYSLYKKTPAWFDRLSEEDVVPFDYDFVALEEGHFQDQPAARNQGSIRFYFTPWQQEYFADQLAFHGKTVQGLGKMYSRIAIKKLQRSVERVA